VPDYSAALNDESVLLQGIGRELLAIADSTTMLVFFYAEPTLEAVSASVLVGDGSTFAPRGVSVDLARLTQALWQLRQAIAPDQAWVALAFVMAGQDFQVDYITRERRDPGDSVGARAAAALQRFTQAPAPPQR